MDYKSIVATRLLSSIAVVLVCSSSARTDEAAENTRGLALCIGLNEVNPAHYGSPLRLRGCRNDASDLKSILQSIDGFAEPELLFDQDATVSAVEERIKRAADQLDAGSLFVLTIAAHGSQLPDYNQDEKKWDPQDRADETWLLWDRMWIDDERAAVFARFKQGVRVIVVADTCHSGTSTRTLQSIARGVTPNGVRGGSSVFQTDGFGLPLGFHIPSDLRAVEDQDAAISELSSITRLQDTDSLFQAFESARRLSTFLKRESTGNDGRSASPVAGTRSIETQIGTATALMTELLGHTPRTIAHPDAVAIYERNAAEYNRYLEDARLAEDRADNQLKATLVLLAACQDSQTAADGRDNGAFTAALEAVWQGGFVGTYRGFVQRIDQTLARQMYSQIPNYLSYGEPSPAVERPQVPFTVKPE